jgi:replication-associated recombination protein RarA
MAIKFYNQITNKGYARGEASSALQKSIRRGLEEEALFWATELDKSGYGEYVWKRLKIIASEDVGLAWSAGPAVVHGLYHSWLEQKKKKDEEHYPERLFLVHAVILLTRAPKSRIVDHALCCFYNNDEDKRPVPDYAFDKHTMRGWRLGRGFEHFFNEASKLENEAPIPDPYRERAERILCQEPKHIGG